jgi:ribosome-associated toxin RatA of RatAB toxin-antitoxin module
LAKGGAIVAYHIDFQLRSRMLQILIGGAIGGRGAVMVAAFKHRARLLYGTPRTTRHAR